MTFLAKPNEEQFTDLTKDQFLCDMAYLLQGCQEQKGTELNEKMTSLYFHNCPFCKGPPIYNEKFDSDLCPKCNKWLVNTCDDKDCIYCKDRPEKPLPEKDT